MDRTNPVPSQISHGVKTPSLTGGEMRCLDISSKPNFDILAMLTRALSDLHPSFTSFSTAALFFFWNISIKSITINPPKSRNLSWRTISTAASRFVVSAVSSRSRPPFVLPELTSTETIASPMSITMEPPEGNKTLRW